MTAQVSVPPSPPAPQAERRPIGPHAGIGLRFPHHRFVAETRPKVAWLEVHTENYMGGGTPLTYLDRIRAEYPISLHGVGLSLGSAEGLDPEHLNRVRDVAARVQPAFVSEHLSWSVLGGTYLADLLPLPMTEDALETVCRHVDQVQDVLGRKLLIENPSSYLQYEHSTIPEPQFLTCVAQRTGCGILCDVNNVYVSATNHGWDAGRYLTELPASAVEEIHLAGHAAKKIGGHTILIDDHGSRVREAVWQLYGEALKLFGPIPTMIEWDNNIPDFSVLAEEASQADRYLTTTRTVDHADAA